MNPRQSEVEPDIQDPNWLYERGGNSGFEIQAGRVTVAYGSGMPSHSYSTHAW